MGVPLLGVPGISLDRRFQTWKPSFVKLEECSELHFLKLTASLPLKMDGWKMILSFWQIRLMFRGRLHSLLVSGVVQLHVQHLDVSQNRGTPKWMVYNGNPY